MTGVIYKRLFEVRILHDFYLADELGTSFFAMNEPVRNARLDKVLRAGGFDIRNELHISPTKETIETMRRQKMRWFITATGFALGIEVNPVEEPGGVIAYKPVLPLEDSQFLAFHLAPISSNFLNYTNLTLKKDSLPLRYLFSNQSATQSGAAAVLSKPAAAFDLGGSYEMGELVNDAGSVREVFFRPNGALDLLDLVGEGFVNRSDKMLLPRQFTFDFQTVAAGLVEVSLRDELGNEVKRYSKDFAGPVQAVALDFSQTDPPGPKPIADGNYSLTVSRSSSFFKQYNIVFQEELATAPASLGGILLRVKTGNPAFDLLDGNGKLLARKLADGTTQPPRLFEVRLLARKTFWRYRSKTGFSGSPPSPQLELSGNMWVTKRPKALSAGWQTFTATNGANLPNAEASALSKESGRVYSDIFISSVNRFYG